MLAFEAGSNQEAKVTQAAQRSVSQGERGLKKVWGEGKHTVSRLKKSAVEQGVKTWEGLPKWTQASLRPVGRTLYGGSELLLGLHKGATFGFAWVLFVMFPRMYEARFHTWTAGLAGKRFNVTKFIQTGVKESTKPGQQAKGEAAGR